MDPSTFLEHPHPELATEERCCYLCAPPPWQNNTTPCDSHALPPCVLIDALRGEKNLHFTNEETKELLTLALSPAGDVMCHLPRWMCISGDHETSLIWPNWVVRIGDLRTTKILGTSPQWRSQLGPREGLTWCQIESQSGWGHRSRMESIPGFLCDNRNDVTIYQVTDCSFWFLLCLWTSSFSSPTTQQMMLMNKFHAIRRQTLCRLGHFLFGFCC